MMIGPRKPPHSVPVLQRWLKGTERATGIAVARQQRWVSFMVLAAMLDRARDPAGQPLFLVKGGVAMELRFVAGARATKDLDLAYRADPRRMLDRLDDALAAGHGDFTAHRSPAEAIRDTGAFRLAIKLAYRTRPWATVQTEISYAEAGIADEIDRLPAKPLAHLGLAGPDEVPAVAVRWQLAQKLHACTEPVVDGRTNDRFRDLIDILLLWDLITPDARPAVTDACRQVFDGRQAHPWPPRLEPPDHWRHGYSAVAAEIAFPLAEVADAVAAVDAIITQLAQGDP